MTSCQWPNPRRLTQVLRCHYPPPLFLRGATMRSFFWIGLSLCIFTVCTKSALAHRPNLSSARDQAAALQSEPVGGPFQGICSSTTAFGSNAMANCDSTVLPHNETAVAVDPNNPAHQAGRLERYRVGERHGEVPCWLLSPSTQPEVCHAALL